MLNCVAISAAMPVDIAEQQQNGISSLSYVCIVVVLRSSSRLPLC
jgi:hypothetical protein